MVGTYVDIRNTFENLSSKLDHWTEYQLNVRDHAQQSDGEFLLEWNARGNFLPTYKSFSAFAKFKGIAPIPTEEDYEANSTLAMAARHFGDWMTNGGRALECPNGEKLLKFAKVASKAGIVLSYERFVALANYLPSTGTVIDPVPSKADFELKMTVGEAARAFKKFAEEIAYDLGNTDSQLFAMWLFRSEGMQMVGKPERLNRTIAHVNGMGFQVKFAPDVLLQFKVAFGDPEKDAPSQLKARYPGLVPQLQLT